MTVELVGWIVAALVGGLWWGERGRRVDLLLLSGRRAPRGGLWKRAKREAPEPEPEPLFNSAERQVAIDQIMRETGVDAETAAQELDALVGGAYGGRVTS